MRLRARAQHFHRAAVGLAVCLTFCASSSADSLPMPVLQPVITAVGCPAAAEACTAQPRLALVWPLLVLRQQLRPLLCARCSCICCCSLAYLLLTERSLLMNTIARQHGAWWHLWYAAVAPCLAQDVSTRWIQPTVQYIFISMHVKRNDKQQHKRGQARKRTITLGFDRCKIRPIPTVHTESGHCPSNAQSKTLQ
jgi:hypothetical protein